MTAGTAYTDQTAALTVAVWSALATVRDPELDAPLTELGFVEHHTVSAGGEAVVGLRLPTYFCAPNFAFLMVADAYDAVSAVPGVEKTVVRLRDHFAADVINNGVAARAGFVASFEGEAVDELDNLRADFVRKAVLAGTDRVCRAMVSSGTDSSSLATLSLGDAPEGPDRERLRARRRELGLPSGDGDALVVDPLTGARIEADRLHKHLGVARITRVSQEANSGVCRGMLRARYPHSVEQEDTP
ncbi:iron-sulfur cluster assembly protein [Amycolatopsis sp.]|uniref:iron-sulfur cluster assembly protein n=1 Tax=Amycolatopsis sp. TaxID=37632 RepID=UPI002E0A043F|nr:iron-sulfur cluster assembly protein [Amycolatopsis sp.]